MRNLFLMLSIFLNIFLSTIIGFVVGVIFGVGLYQVSEEDNKWEKAKRVQHQENKKKEPVGFDISNVRGMSK